MSCVGFKYNLQPDLWSLLWMWGGGHGAECLNDLFWPLSLPLKVMASAEAWVGPWRPHKPRGPIAALYGSPGPKYALPGLTGDDWITAQYLCSTTNTIINNWSITDLVCQGINKHDMTRNKAPAFSLGTLHAQISAASSPGPKYLIPSNITRRGRDGTPAFSLHSRPKELSLLQIPGPGQWTPHTGFVLITVVSATSAPLFVSGQYSPERSSKSIFHSAPAFSLSWRSKDMSLDKTPGNSFYLLSTSIHPTVRGTN